MSGNFRRRFRHERLALVLCGISLSAAAGCVSLMANMIKTKAVEQQTFAVATPPTVIVETFNGAIQVQPTDENRVTAVVTKTGTGPTQEASETDLRNIAVEFAQDGDTIRVIARRTGVRVMGSSQAEIALSVPRRSTLSLGTSNGAITTDAIQGPIVAKTSNGRVAIQGGQGKLDLETSNGAIEIEATDATVHAGTSNGRVSFAGTLARGSHAMTTSNGAIDLRLPSHSQCHVNARTSNGKVHNEFAPSQGESSRNRFNGFIGAATAETAEVNVKLETSNGRIAISPLDLPHAEAPPR